MSEVKEKNNSNIENETIQQVQKPVELIVEDVKEQIIRILNETQLGFCFSVMILESLLLKYKDSAREIEKQIRIGYEQQLNQINQK